MLRVLALEGQNNLLDTFSHWKRAEDDPFIMGVTFTHQLLDALRDVRASATVLSMHHRVGQDSADGLTVEHRDRLQRNLSGLAYKAELLRLSVDIEREARRMRADVVMTVGFPPTGLLLPLLYSGRHLVVTNHCVLWRKAGVPSRMQRLLFPLEQRAFLHRRCTNLAVSDDIAAQIRQICRRREPRIVQFFPLYRAAMFASIPAPRFDASDFRIAYVGRTEPEKGIFDLLEVARGLFAKGRPVSFDVCGHGAALPELREKVRSLGFETRFRLHGWCNQERLRGVLAGTHVVAVPTRSEFIEGFNMVVVESLLAGRPVITSATCPALSYVRSDAVLEVGVDDVGGYGRAIERLLDDPAQYERAIQACKIVAAPFLEEKYSYRAAVREALLAIIERREPGAIGPTADRLHASRAEHPGQAFAA